MNDDIRMAGVDEMLSEGAPVDDVEDVEDVEPETIEVPLSLDDPEFVASLDAEIGAHIEQLTRPNRAERRRGLRMFRRRFVRADAGVKRLHHPFLVNRHDDSPRLTVWGVKEMARRRRADKVAAKSKRRNRGKG